MGIKENCLKDIKGNKEGLFPGICIVFILFFFLIALAVFSGCSGADLGVNPQIDTSSSPDTTKDESPDVEIMQDPNDISWIEIEELTIRIS